MSAYRVNPRLFCESRLAISDQSLHRGAKEAHILGIQFQSMLCFVVSYLRFLWALVPEAS